MSESKQSIGENALEDSETIQTILNNIILEIESTLSRKKRVAFKNVDLFVFERTQGFECIPSDGSKNTITLGMSKNHVHAELFNSLEEHLIWKRIQHLERLEEEKTKIITRRLEIKYIANNSFLKSKKVKTLSPDMLVSDYTDEEANKILDVVSNKKEYENIEVDLPVNTDIFCPILSAEERYAKLVEEGFSETEIDKNETDEILKIQLSREITGCKCGLYGLECGENKNCSCFSNGIGCQVDKPRYPCYCSVKKCKNPNGLKRFDYQSVVNHYNQILRKTVIEEPIVKPNVKRKRKSLPLTMGKKRKT